MFKRRADEYLEIRQRLSPGITKLSVSRQPNGTFSAESDMPSEDQLRSLYLSFRFFFQQDEPCHFPKVLKIIGRKFPHDPVNIFLKNLKDQWQRPFKNSSFVEFLRRKVDAHELLNLWFNAHYFHSDLDKEKELYEINQIFSENLSRFLLYDTVMCSGLAVINLKKSIQDLKKDSLQLYMPKKLLNKGRP